MLMPLNRPAPFSVHFRVSCPRDFPFARSWRVKSARFRRAVWRERGVPLMFCRRAAIRCLAWCRPRQTPSGESCWPRPLRGDACASGRERSFQSKFILIRTCLAQSLLNALIHPSNRSFFRRTSYPCLNVQFASIRALRHLSRVAKVTSVATRAWKP